MQWENEAAEALSRLGYSVAKKDGSDDYNGWGVLLGKNMYGSYVTLAWTYGSCRECDDYYSMSRSSVVTSLTNRIDYHSSEKEALVAFYNKKSW